MRDDRWYAVIPIQDGEPAPDGAETFPNLDRAVEYYDSQPGEETRGGGEWDIFAMRPVGESARWEWATRLPYDDSLPMQFVSESAARNSLHGRCELLRRRRGTEEWIPVPAAAAEGGAGR